MNHPAITVHISPRALDCEAAVCGRLVVAAVLAAATAALEAWLRIPVQPLLDGYMQVAVSRASSIAALFFKPSF